MEQSIRLEASGAIGAELRLYAVGSDVCLRVLERRGGRLVFLTRYCVLPPIPDDDEWEVQSGNASIACSGTLVRVLVDGREVGRLNVLALGMYVLDVRRHIERMESPLPPPDGP